jgi:phage portal protein BeeE
MPSRSGLSLSDYVDFFKFGPHFYGMFGMNQTMPGEKQEPIHDSFQSYVTHAYRQNGVVFACLLARMLLFSEMRFTFRDRRTGDLFGSTELGPLEVPWPGATTGDLLARAEQDSSLAGNFFAARRGSRIMRMRPDWVTIVAGSPGRADTDLTSLDAEVVGYVYEPGGRWSGLDPVFLGADEVAHYAPIPDPEFRFRGMSWLGPIVAEIMGDQAATVHKRQFFEQGATANHAIVFDKDVVKSPDEFQKWVDLIEESHAGLENAYRTLYLAAGATVQGIGSDMKQIDFKVVQGAGETRIAAAAGVPPIIVGLSEGLASATYSNYGQARRRFADLTMRPLWRNLAGSFATIVEAPAGSELWYDDRDIPALREDAKDRADTIAAQANAIRTLTDGGFDPVSVVEAVTAGDLTLLEHSGLTSVQLLPPGLNGEVASTSSLAGSARGKESGT